MYRYTYINKYGVNGSTRESTGGEMIHRTYEVASFGCDIYEILRTSFPIRK